MNTIFDKVLDANMDFLGHYDSEKSLIMLYDVPNDPDLLNELKMRTSLITTNFKFTVVKVNGDYCNVGLLDVGI